MLLFMKYGIKIEKYMAAGRYKHKVYDMGVKSDRVGAVNEYIVDALKKVNEKIWDQLPEKSEGLVAIIKYQIPKK